MKNLILGTALNYGALPIRNFVKSIRRFNTQADVILLVNDDYQKDPELTQLLEDHNITPQVFATHCIADTGVNNGRYLRYLEILHTRDPNEHVLMADVRDLVFQGDPFEYTTSELTLFEEDRGIPIGACPHNSDWMIQIQGPELLDRLKDKPIICSGTIMSPVSKAIDFIREFRTLLLDIRANRPHAYKSVVIDQAMVNVMAYTQPNTWIIKPNGDTIGTVGQTVTNPARAQDTIQYHDDHITVNGLKPSIIHQYDRCARMIQMFDHVYNHPTI